MDSNDDGCWKFYGAVLLFVVICILVKALVIYLAERFG